MRVGTCKIPTHPPLLPPLIDLHVWFVASVPVHSGFFTESVACYFLYNFPGRGRGVGAGILAERYVLATAGCIA